MSVLMQQCHYFELHACSAFSFLEGASTPEELVETARRQGHKTLALLDRDGVYGAPRFYKACRQAGIRSIVGSDVTLADGTLSLLVASRTGYQNLCQLITNMKLRAEKGAGRLELDELEARSEGLICLTGGETGFLRQLAEPERVLQNLDRLKQIFGPRNVYVELQRHFLREQERKNQLFLTLAAEAQLPVVATNGVRYAEASKRPLMDVLSCIRHRTRLDEAGRLLDRNSECHLKSPPEMARIWADLPEAVAATEELAERLDFTLRDRGYRFPDYPVPCGENMNSYLRRLTLEGARRRYRPFYARARRQIEHELRLIEKLDLAGYFLIVWDIARFCRRNDILAQGRGSAANSAVCYSLGITAVDPVGMDLLFERFLSEERGEWPDIDLDLPSGDRREQVIQYVYDRYGRYGAAMTANVITYRARSASREVGKVLGFSDQTLGRLSKLVRTWGLSNLSDPAELQQRLDEAGLEFSAPRVRLFLQLWHQIQNLPRHLGQHSGGMVICRGRLDHVVPLENARMPGRSVVQWDKDDCADLGIIKVDLLGLGMMSALQDCIQILKRDGHELDLAHLPPDDPKTYQMFQRADTIGVFQVESRAQMATLPRLKPKCFYDLVVEVAIIRPGPIVGDMVHPYLRRRAGLEKITYPHPSLKPILERTLGVPVFQEQLLRVAMAAAGFSGGEAEELRRAMGFKRPDEAMNRIERKLRQGLEQNRITGDAAETIVRYITSFAQYGFPESHAASFALLTYASTYIKAHYPAHFYAALLNNQPMGFYHPATLVKDAQHRRQRVRPIDIQRSNWLSDVEADGSLRLGLMLVKGLREEKGRRVEQERRSAPFGSVSDLVARVGLNRKEITTLAEIGALNSLGKKRRAALWQAEKASRPSGPLFERADSRPDREISPLKEMDAVERLRADYSGSGVTIGPHPMALLRKELQKRKVLAARQLAACRSGSLVRVAGCVIVRQRPVSAKGFLFLSLEDETGISNIIVHPAVFERNRPVLVTEPLLIIDGVVQNEDNVISVRAKTIRPLDDLLANIRQRAEKLIASS